MLDPVMDRNGHNFEKSAITQWLQRHNTCPVGREPLSVSDLFPNRALKELIQSAARRPAPAPRTPPPAQGPNFAPTVPAPGVQPRVPQRPAPLPPQQQQYYQQPQPQAYYQPQPQPQLPPPSANPWENHAISQEEYDHLMCVFCTFDTDGSGQLDKKEIQRLCKYMNYPSTDADISRLFSAVDVDRSGTIDMDEFVRYMQHHRPRPEVQYGITEERYTAILMNFHEYDDDRNGELDRSELQRMCREKHLGLSERDVDHMFSVMDTNHNGRLDLHEFLTYMRDHDLNRPYAPPGQSPPAGYNAAYNPGYSPPAPSPGYSPPAAPYGGSPAAGGFPAYPQAFPPQQMQYGQPQYYQPAPVQNYGQPPQMQQQQQYQYQQQAPPPPQQQQQPQQQKRHGLFGMFK
eukprot:TRINITY_DN95570_c0_g1_i1.p1 TRINITY_DN95570_c0_g1~~TRINITY_DN95570_c0_g1_i1.p1  ORF type:complete len:441 (-),score=79.81 TRINITY_DN95570_c0_g1_i1:3-1208(-)